MTVGQVKTDPITTPSIAATIYTAWTGDSDASLLAAALVSGSPNRAALGAQIQAIATAIDAALSGTIAGGPYAPLAHAIRGDGAIAVNGDHAAHDSSALWAVTIADADATHTGAVTAATQTLGGDKTLQGAWTLAAGTAATSGTPSVAAPVETLRGSYYASGAAHDGDVTITHTPYDPARNEVNSSLEFVQHGLRTVRFFQTAGGIQSAVVIGRGVSNAVALGSAEGYGTFFEWKGNFAMAVAAAAADVGYGGSGSGHVSTVLLKAWDTGNIGLTSANTDPALGLWGSLGVDGVVAVNLRTAVGSPPAIGQPAIGLSYFTPLLWWTATDWLQIAQGADYGHLELGDTRLEELYVLGGLNATYQADKHDWLNGAGSTVFFRLEPYTDGSGDHVNLEIRNFANTGNNSAIHNAFETIYDASGAPAGDYNVTVFGYDSQRSGTGADLVSTRVQGWPNVELNAAGAGSGRATLYSGGPFKLEDVGLEVYSTGKFGGLLTLLNSLQLKVTQVAATPHTLALADGTLIGVKTSSIGADTTITMPSAASVLGVPFVIFDMENAAATHKILLDWQGSDTDQTGNAASYEIKINGTGALVFAYDTHKFFVAKFSM